MLEIYILLCMCNYLAKKVDDSEHDEGTQLPIKGK